ncbi:MAG: helix-turn-helix transcriptional regulator [Bacteroidota bacterium]
MKEISNRRIEWVELQEELDFRLFKIEDILSFEPSLKKNPFRPHRTNFFTLLLLTKGEMSHEVDFKAYKMVKGDCLFISKEQIHKFDASPSYEGYGFVFTEEFMLQHFSLSAFSKISFLYNYHLIPPLFKDFGDQAIFLRALKREFSLELGEVEMDVVASILSVFLLKAQFHLGYELKSNNGDYTQFIQFQKLVATKYMETRITKHYALLLNMTHKQLNSLCKTFTKMTAKEYIINYLIMEAKRQLATTNLPVKQIAFECGFDEATNFLKFFKKNTGMTPTIFREIGH